MLPNPFFSRVYYEARVYSGCVLTGTVLLKVDFLVAQETHARVNSGKKNCRLKPQFLTKRLGSQDGSHLTRCQIYQRRRRFSEKKKGAKKEQHCSHFPANIIFFVRWEANPFLPPLGRPRTTKVTRVSSWRTIRVNSGMGHLAQIEDSILEIFWPSGNARVNSGFGPSNHQKCGRFRAEQVT